MAAAEKEVDSTSSVKRPWDECMSQTVDCASPSYSRNDSAQVVKRKRHSHDAGTAQAAPDESALINGASSSSNIPSSASEHGQGGLPSAAESFSNICHGNKVPWTTDNGQLSAVCHDNQAHGLYSRPDVAPDSTTRVRSVSDDKEEEEEDDGDDKWEDVDSEDNVSEISNLSGMSSAEGWRPITGPMMWVQKQLNSGADPRAVLRQLIPGDESLLASNLDDLDDITIWKVIINILMEPPRRKKLKHVNTLADVLALLRKSSRIIVLTGAGVSVSCGIPDFRSRDGIYSRLAVEYPDLPDPAAMFDIHYFRRNPRPFFKFAKEIYPGQFEPSTSHRFVKLLEDENKLLRNYSQNIDTLEQVAGLSNVIQCHGSFATATCMLCKHKVNAEDIRHDILNQVIPRCAKCPGDAEMAILKPDIVFFGEELPTEFHRMVEIDKDVCDLLIVIGSSLKVQPVALIPNALPAHVPQILINREPLRHMTFDVELLGDCDTIVRELCAHLGDGWTSISGDSYVPAEEVALHEASTPPALSPECSSSSKHSLTKEEMGDMPQLSASSSSSIRTSDEPGDVSGDGQAASSLQAPESSTATTDLEVTHSMKTTTTSKCEPGIEMETTTTSDIDVILDTQITAPDTKTTLGTTTMSDTNTATSHSEDESALGKDKASVAVDGGGSGDVTSHCSAVKPAIRVNLADSLKGNVYLFVPPNRYVFHGAEVYVTESDSNRGDLTSDSESEAEAESSSTSLPQTAEESERVRSPSLSTSLPRPVEESGNPMSSSSSLPLSVGLSTLPQAVEESDRLRTSCIYSAEPSAHIGDSTCVDSAAISSSTLSSFLEATPPTSPISSTDKSATRTSEQCSAACGKAT